MVLVRHFVVVQVVCLVALCRGAKQVPLLGVAPSRSADAVAAIALVLSRLKSKGALCGWQAGCDIELAVDWLELDDASVQGSILSSLNTFNLVSGESSSGIDKYAGVICGYPPGQVAGSVLVSSTMARLPAFAYSPLIPAGGIYGYFFRTTASLDREVPFTLLSFAGILQWKKVGLAIIIGGDYADEADFDLIVQRLDLLKLSRPTVVKVGEVIARTSSSSPCSTAHFGLLHTVRGNLLKIVIAIGSVLDYRCLLCASLVTSPSPEDVNLQLIWLLGGDVGSKWWAAQDTGVERSVERVGGAPVGMTCNATALTRAAEFYHFTASTQLWPRNLHDGLPWRCGNTSLGSVGELRQAAGTFEQAALVADLLCANALAIGSVLANKSEGEVETESFKQGVRSALTDQSLIDFRGASGGRIAFGVPRDGVVVIRQMYNQTLNYVTEWVQLDSNRDIYLPPEGAFTVYFDKESSIWWLEPVNKSEPKVEEELEETRYDTRLDWGTTALVIVVLLVICIVIALVVAYVVKIWLRWRESRAIRSAVEFLEDLRWAAAEYAEMTSSIHHWKFSRDVTSGVGNLTPSDAGIKDSQVRVLCFYDPVSSNPSDSIRTTRSYLASYEPLLIKALQALCYKEHIDINTVVLSVIIGSNFKDDDEDSVFGGTVSEPSRRGRSSWCGCCSDNSSVTPLYSGSDGLSSWSRIVFAVDVADYCLLVVDGDRLSDEEGRLNNSFDVLRFSARATSVSKPKVSAAECLECGRDPRRAFTSLCIMALKGVQEAYIYDRTKLKPFMRESDLADFRKVDNVAAGGVAWATALFWGRFSSRVRASVKKGGDAQVAAAQTGILQVWSAAVSHGQPDFVKFVVSYQSWGYWKQNDPLFGTRPTYVYSHLAHSDAPLYFPVNPPDHAPTFLLSTHWSSVFPWQQMAHGTRDTDELHTRRREVVRLARALKVQYASPLPFPDSGFIAPGKHRRARHLFSSLAYFEKLVHEKCIAATTPTPLLGQEKTTASSWNVNSSLAELAISTKTRLSALDIMFDGEIPFCGGMHKSGMHAEASFGNESRMRRQSTRSSSTLEMTTRSSARKNGPHGRCQVGGTQCPDCLTKRRFSEGLLAIQALVPQVQAFLDAFVLTIRDDEALRVQSTLTVDDNDCYSLVYGAVLRLIRTEWAYEALVDKADEVIPASVVVPPNHKCPLELILCAIPRHLRLQEYVCSLAEAVGRGVRGGSSLESVPKVKHIWRILEKSALLGERFQPTGFVTSVITTDQVFDVSRTTMICNDCAEIRAALSLISADSSPVRVCRGKNRFRTPSAGGWADILLNIVWKDDTEDHVMEVQFVHTKLMLIRRSNAFEGHESYGRCRAAMEVLEILTDLDGNDVKERIQPTLHSLTSRLSGLSD
eukprot:TRINITY_DN18392_c0_g1_i1.p1 TRINITY_DN18392_c0_g1~~TRINITY_DN18392_c0_g1_i1.p1  ORF type:complete len:1487 (-),score=209.74 TRINITY_DN18392_c0_g1_i1:172-4338(-)